MMRQAKIILTIILLSLSAQVLAQNVKTEIASLENNFKAFEYKKVIQKGKFLLADPYTTSEDSTLIYQFMLSSAYALNDTVRAKEFILDLLKNRPDFFMNPINTSPKIVEFFNLIKKEHLIESQIQPPDSTTFRYPTMFEKPKSSTLVLGVIFPGSAHLLQGEIKKGRYFSAVSAILLSSTVYYYFKTQSDRETYMKARDGANFNRLYADYNAAYKTRNILSAAYGIWSLYCLFDFNKNFPIRPIYKTNQQSLSLVWQYQW